MYDSSRSNDSAAQISGKGLLFMSEHRDVALKATRTWQNQARYDSLSASQPCASSEIGAAKVSAVTPEGVTNPTDLIALIPFGKGEYDSACYHAGKCRYVYTGGTTSSSTSITVQSQVSVSLTGLEDGLYECAFFHVSGWSNQVNTGGQKENAILVMGGKSYPVSKMHDDWKHMTDQFGIPTPQPISVSSTKPVDSQVTSATVSASTSFATGPTDLIALVPFGSGKYDGPCYHSGKCRYVYAGGTTSSTTSKTIQPQVSVNLRGLVDGLYECAFFRVSGWSSQLNNGRQAVNAILDVGGKAYPVLELKEQWEGMRSQYVVS